MFNLPNLLDKRWGLVRESSSTEAKRQLLRVRTNNNWDPVANRPRYEVFTGGDNPLPPSRNTVLIDESRWRIQLGGRYSF